VSPPLSRVRAADLLPVGTIGLRTRRVRAALSVLGVAIGIAALVAVLGITRSSQADLLGRIDRLGTNLLTVVNGHTVGGDEAQLPVTAAASVAGTDGVLASSATAELTSVRVYRSDRIPGYRSGGVSVRACDVRLMSTLDGHLAHGTFLDEATQRYPVTVLGYAAAQALGIADLGGSPRIWIGGHWFTVIGILRPFELAPEIDRSVLIGFPPAGRDFGYDGHPSRVYVRAVTDRTEDVAGLLARATDPRHPEQVAVSRPSDTLVTRLAVAGATTSLFLGLGAVALLVGAVGVANIMVISVLERRSEIGLRRALGATKGHIRIQFLSESILLALAGGVAGVLAGIASTAVYAHAKGWAVVVPAIAWAGGTGAAILIGALAGLLPALRAARMPPTQALWSL
jgi:putative ABC transport system permease protein